MSNFWPGLVAVTLTFLAGAAHACERPLPGQGPVHPAINVRVDNDVFGGQQQDRGYSNGFLFTLMSSNLRDDQDPDCLPAIARGINRYLDWLHPGAYEQMNMVLTVGQALFTPADRNATGLVRNDRPYAAILMVGVGYNARAGDHLRSSQLRLGIVGPSARGKQVQDAWHKIIGEDRFLGWDNQLHDEPLVQLVHERMRRWAPVRTQGGWGRDFVAHWGGSLGNRATYLNAGAEWRYGLRLPDDFGSSPLRPAGDNTAPVRSDIGPDEWRAHVFASVDARAVAQDVTLDGNSFRDSHRVDKRKLVGDLGYGLVVMRGNWKVAFARYHRTREFSGQSERPVFGSVTVTRRF
jgi:lipid A 3-O-deacylase